MSSNTLLQPIKELLENGNLHEALVALNSGVPHRFSGIYVLRDGVFHNIVLVDKLAGPTPPYLQSVPFEHSFCQYVMRDNGVDIADSTADARLDGHPYQGVVVAYSGVPVTDPAREVVGTLCHFDTMNHRLEPSQYRLMWELSPWIATLLPGSPASRH